MVAVVCGLACSKRRAERSAQSRWPVHHSRMLAAECTIHCHFLKAAVTNGVVTVFLEPLHTLCRTLEVLEAWKDIVEDLHATVKRSMFRTQLSLAAKENLVDDHGLSSSASATVRVWIAKVCILGVGPT